MGVYLGRSYMAMPQKFLDNAYVYPILQKVCRIAMTECVHRCFFGNQCSVQCLPHNLLHTSFRVDSSFSSFKYILFWMIFPIIHSQKIEKLWGKWHISIFLSFGLSDLDGHSF